MRETRMTQQNEQLAKPFVIAGTALGGLAFLAMIAGTIIVAAQFGMAAINSLRNETEKWKGRDI